MKKHLIRSFIVVLLTSALLGAATQTICTLPVQNSAFLSTLQAFLKGEEPSRFQAKYAGYVLQGGIGTTSATLAHTISALTAFPGGYYVYKAATSHTYIATTTTYVYADYDDTRTISIDEATVTRSGHLVFATKLSGASEPVQPTKTVRLMKVDTNGTAITAVTDLRTGGKIDVEAYGNLATAVANAPPCELQVTRSETLTTNVTIPSTISLYINKGALVTCTGHVLTINGPLLSTGPYQQFVAVAGEVVFSDTSYVNAAWFGFAESASAAANSAALLAAVTVGNTCINSGTFLLSVQVEIPSNRRVYGAGIGSSILKIPDNVSAGTVATLSPLTTANGGSDILIENLTIDGNRANQSWTPVGSANYGLSVRSSNTVVRNCEFKNVTANGTGVPVTASNVIFDGVISHGNGKKGLHSGDVNKITIINGFYYDNEIDSGIGLHQGATEVIVANNQCYDNGTYGIHVGASTGAYEVSRNVAITGNIIFGNNVGIYLVNNSTSDIEKDLGVSIIGNTIKGNGQGIQTTAAYGFTIADNIIKENDIYGVWINTNSTRYIINGNIIYNNCLTDTSKAAVTLQAGTSNGIVRGNYLYDNQDSATQVRGILIGGTVTGTVVADNHIENATTVAIDDYSSIGVNTVQNNIRINSGSAENNVFSGHTIIRNVTSVTRTGTTDETDLMAAATILAKKMDSVNGVRFTAWGRNTGAAGTKTIKFYWGATAYTVHPADNNASEWRLDVEIQNVSSSSQCIWLLMRTGGIITSDDYTTASVVTTEAVSVKLTGQLSDGSDSISQYRLWGEYF
jgi:parallel beta-helix repeat protein